ncbi:MAG: phosphoribosylformylglycinamidine cyclo-ligase [bacterium]|nr:phosphoribosylformylglycinamidine cyclo-ligase [bacterium]
MNNKISYSDAGVDIDLAQSLLKKVKSKIALAKRPEMLAPVGGFGGLFQLDLSKYNKPILVSSIDGIGTKILVAIKMGKFDTLGYDIVHHCINDIAVQGAEPLYFLDYFGTGKLKSPQYEEVLCGIADACANNNCALLGGETAEMPGMYGDDFDLVGVINGVVDKDKLITGEHINENCVAIGLNSNGLHTNGYSLARKVLFEAGKLDVFDKHELLVGDSVGEALLKPHTCYWKAVKGLFDADVSIKGVAHITGGGLYDNVPRILPKSIGAEFYTDALPIPPIFKLIKELGNIETRELYRTFNMGIGMVLFVDSDEADKTLKTCTDLGYKAALCGRALKNNNEIIVK